MTSTTQEKIKFDRNRKRVDFCPCGKSNRDQKFSPFVGEEAFGHCHSCDKTFYKDSPQNFNKQIPEKKIERRIDLIPAKVFNTCMNSKSNNNFILFLNSVFGERVSKGLKERYNIGTLDEISGSTVFFQKDLNGNIRTGHIMQYDPSKGKRTNYNNWIHNKIGISEFSLDQVFFGLHLINLPENLFRPIAIVESEKTAIICSAVMPWFTWLATCGSGGINARKLSYLTGRNVVLFPDAAKLEQWTNKANEFKNICKLTVNTLINDLTNKNYQGYDYDIADYILSNKNHINLIANWNENVHEIRHFFNNRKLSNAVKLLDKSIIVNPRKQIADDLEKMINNPLLENELEEELKRLYYLSRVANNKLDPYP